MLNNVMNIVENEQSSEFYPTPASLVEKMISGIHWESVKTILEPSAGKGDILREVAKNEEYKQFDVDCIEIDSNLRQILKYNFGDRKLELQNEIENITSKYNYCNPNLFRYYNNTTKQYEDLPRKDVEKLEKIKMEKETFFSNGIHIVHDDFLTYKPYKRYDLILMNPPFSNGDKHLLKALQMQEKGGNIVCLLNAETLRNPYTESRKELIRQLDKYDADIEYIENAFISSERKTGVEIALIKIAIENVQEKSDIYEKMAKAENVDDVFEDSTYLDVTDYIKSMIVHFNVEVKAGLELIRQYRALKPYITCSFSDNPYEKGGILRLINKNGNSYDQISVNEYLKDTRLKYWRKLFSNRKFTEKLTSKLQDEWREKVGTLSDYDFTEFNIQTVIVEMNSQVKQGIEDEIIAMFDRLTAEHSYYPEFSKNRHYYNGWKTNKAHKIGNKVIIPCYDVFSGWSSEPQVYKARNVLEDIERIFNFLDGGMTRELNSWNFIDYNFKNGVTKNIECKYFKATFYKKGTVHLVFTCPELIDRFNIYAAQQKQWLPPSYGRKTYKDMSNEEKAVVDSFQGEKEYNKIMNNSDYYLAPVTNNQILRLE